MKTKRVEFGGESFTVPADARPTSITQAQRMQRALKAAEKPAEAPSARSATPAPKKSTTRSQPRPTASTGASASTRAAQDRIDAIGRRADRGTSARSGDPRTQSGYNRIGASMPPTQKRTASAPTAFKEGQSSTGGRSRYDANTRLREDARNANDLQLAVRAGKFHTGQNRSDRNALADAEIYRRARERAERPRTSRREGRK
jgi:hypothetical protein